VYCGASQQTGAERIVGRRFFVTEHARQQSDDCIDKNYSCNRAVGEDIITDRYLKIDKMFDDTVINSLVVSADDNEVRLLRKLAWPIVDQNDARRRHENHLCRF